MFIKNDNIKENLDIMPIVERMMWLAHVEIKFIDY